MWLEGGEETLGDVEGGEEDCFEHSIGFGIRFTCLAGSVIIDVVVSHHANGREVGGIWRETRSQEGSMMISNVRVREVFEVPVD